MRLPSWLSGFTISTSTYSIPLCSVECFPLFSDGRHPVVNLSLSDCQNHHNHRDLVDASPHRAENVTFSITAQGVDEHTGIIKDVLGQAGEASRLG